MGRKWVLGRGLVLLSEYKEEMVESEERLMFLKLAGLFISYENPMSFEEEYYSKLADMFRQKSLSPKGNIICKINCFIRKFVQEEHVITGEVLTTKCLMEQFSLCQTHVDIFYFKNPEITSSKYQLETQIVIHLIAIYP